MCPAVCDAPPRKEIKAMSGSLITQVGFYLSYWEIKLESHSRKK